MALYNVQVPARNGDLLWLEHPTQDDPEGEQRKESRGRKSSWWQNMERGIWFSTLSRRRDGLKSGSTLNPRKWLLKKQDERLGNKSWGQRHKDRPAGIGPDHYVHSYGMIAPRLPVKEKLLELGFQMADSERARNGFIEMVMGASLVAQWLRIRLPMQGIRVRALVQEDPTCRGATRPVCHNY